jgi:predicted dehydrogenase
LTPVRWGLAGFGVGGRLFHAPLIASAPGIELVAVVSTNQARAEQARALGLVDCADFAALASLGVEGVTITTPAGTHADLAHEALDAGLHVVVDKPFALTADQARDVVAHAARLDRQLSVYQNRRWDGDFLTVRECVEAGALGAVRRFESRIERFHPDLPQWTRASPVEGGGTLVDLGPHLIDQAVQLFGPVRTVFAELTAFADQAVAEDDVLLLLHHAEGVRSTIVASLAAAVEGPRFRVSGERGGILIDGFDAQEAQLFAGESPATLGADWGREPADRVAQVVVDGVSGSRPLVNGRWTVFYPAMARAIREGDHVPVDPEDAVHVCSVFDAARLSSAEGRVVELAPA